MAEQKDNSRKPSLDEPLPEYVREFLRQVDQSEVEFLKSFIRTMMAMGKVGKLLGYLCTIPAVGLGFWAAVHWMAEQFLGVRGGK